jgi:REP element-mobilizing transposase RayT
MTPVHHQNHTTWECKNHIALIPKYRKTAIFGVTTSQK